MAKRSGLFRRIIGAVIDVFKPSSPPPQPRPTVTQPSAQQPTYIPIERLRKQAVDRLVNTLPHANRTTVARNVATMDRDEIRWTLSASSGDIQNRAMADADRVAQMPNGNLVPSNPWWYH